MQKIFLLWLVFFGIIPSVLGAGDTLELSITPIRNSITVTFDKPATWSVTLYNNTDQVRSFTMSAEDCTTNTNNGTPLCHPVNGGLTPNSLSSWIVFDTSWLFSVPAKWKRTISYQLNAPANAIPGGHYAAIFFNTPTTGGASISMNRRIGSLLLATVPGDIIVNPEFWNIIVTGGGWISPIWPSIIRNLFSPSQTGSILERWKKLLMEFSNPDIQNQIIDFINPFWSAPEIKPDDTFKTDIQLPVVNRWTIHIIPEWKITLHEPDGTQLKNIGREMVKNDNGAIIGEKIVDYLLINEENGAILPGTNRIFTMSWNGFAHEYITASGSIGIIFESPGTYYSRITKENQWYLYPWEKLIVSHTKKQINAKVHLGYANPVSKEMVIKDSEVPIAVEYDEIVKSWNTGLLFIVFIVLLLLYIIFRRRKKQPRKEIRDTSDEIAALEQAQSLMFAKMAAKLEKAGIKKTIRNKTPKE